MFGSILDDFIDLLIVHFEFDDGAREYCCEFRKKDHAGDVLWCLSRCVHDGVAVGDNIPCELGLDPANIADVLAGYTEEGERYLSITYSF